MAPGRCRPAGGSRLLPLPAHQPVALDGQLPPVEALDEPHKLRVAHARVPRPVQLLLDRAGVLEQRRGRGAGRLGRRLHNLR